MKQLLAASFYFRHKPTSGIALCILSRGGFVRWYFKSAHFMCLLFSAHLRDNKIMRSKFINRKLVKRLNKKSHTYIHFRTRSCVCVCVCRSLCVCVCYLGSIEWIPDGWGNALPHLYFSLPIRDLRREGFLNAAAPRKRCMWNF